MARKAASAELSMSISRCISPAESYTIDGSPEFRAEREFETELAQDPRSEATRALPLCPYVHCDVVILRSPWMLGAGCCDADRRAPQHTYVLVIPLWHCGRLSLQRPAYLYPQPGTHRDAYRFLLGSATENAIRHD
jgi:hypothetical protein